VSLRLAGSGGEHTAGGEDDEKGDEGEEGIGPHGNLHRRLWMNVLCSVSGEAGSPLRTCFSTEPDAVKDAGVR
jgi:hypothetical protein